MHSSSPPSLTSTATANATAVPSLLPGCSLSVASDAHENVSNPERGFCSTTRLAIFLVERGALLCAGRDEMSKKIRNNSFHCQSHCRRCCAATATAQPLPLPLPLPLPNAQVPSTTTATPATTGTTATPVLVTLPHSHFHHHHNTLLPSFFAWQYNND
jgi:hypothetical protein